MRLTFKVSTAGAGGFMDMPLLPRDGAAYSDGKGGLREDEVRRDLSRSSGVQFSSGDGPCVLAFVTEFLDRTKMSFARLMEQNPDFTRKEEGEASTPSERRMKRGKFAGVRVDVSFSYLTGYRVALAISNPHDAVGDTDTFARILAQTFADTITAIRDDLTDVPSGMFHFVEGKGCAGVFTAAQRRLAADEANARREKCRNRVGDFCSPINPDCDCYRNGKCVACEA